MSRPLFCRRRSSLPTGRVRHGVTFAASALILLMIPVLAFAGALAPEGLSLGWDDCRSAPGTGSVNKNFGCGVALNDMPLFPAVRLAAPIDSVLSVELVIDVVVADVALPEWWHMEPGGCHSTPPAWTASLATTASCPDAWGGGATASFQGWLPGVPGASPDHGRLLAAVAALPGTSVTLAAGDAQVLCRLGLKGDNTLTCSGCTTPACLVFNSITIHRLPGSVPEQVTFAVQEAAGLGNVVWQGGAGADCQAVPVRRRAWGAVKALYR